jgi:hypothetical protein
VDSTGRGCPRRRCFPGDFGPAPATQTPVDDWKRLENSNINSEIYTLRRVQKVS